MIGLSIKVNYYVMECIVDLVAVQLHPKLRKFYNKFQILLAFYSIFDGFDFFPLTISFICGILFCRYIVVCIFLIARY